MKVHDLVQGSQAWLAYRATHFNASDAPAMMGCSPYKTRAQLMRELHTGVPAEVDVGTQMRFNNGHRAEALARPLAEEFVGEELYPCVGSEGRLSASFDGLTLDECIGFEHKALNDELRAAVIDEDSGARLPLMHRVQMEQQMLVSGAERVLFMTSSWTAEGDLNEERHCWYFPDLQLRQAIVDGWAQFERDLAAFVLPEPAPEPARAEAMESLPAVSVRLDGALSVVGNLPSFAEALRAFVARIPKQPATDNDFATTEAACKALKRAEEALDAAEAGALASITDVESMRRAVADCRKLARDTRLAAEKLVDRRKLEIKEQAVMAARRALDQHVADLNGELAPMRLQPVQADFAGAIKGLRSIASMQDALDTALAAGKIAADAQARVIRGNVATFAAQADGLQFLFADLGQIVHKAPDDFAALLHSRIAQHQIAEQARESARKKAEEARIAAEAKRLADEAIRQAEAQRVEAERLAAQQAQDAAVRASTLQAAAVVVERLPEAVKAGAIEPAQAERIGGLVASIAASAAVEQASKDQPATLKLGDIAGRLGFALRADFVGSVLHIQPAHVAGVAQLYTERQFALICRQLQSHVSAMAELYAGVDA